MEYGGPSVLQNPNVQSRTQDDQVLGYLLNRSEYNKLGKNKPKLYRSTISSHDGDPNEF